MYTQGKPTRNSPGIFAILIRFTRKREAALLAVPLPLVIGFASTVLHWFKVGGPLNWLLFWRDFLLFGSLMLAGTGACLLFRKRARIFTPTISLLMNGYFTFFYALCYEGGHFLLIFYVNPAILEVFFILGAILAYIIAFVIYFSFTTVGRPWYVFLALVQPALGIFLYSFMTSQVSVVFYVKNMLFFTVCAVIFAVPYSMGMFSVSKAYRKSTGIGGYNFVRAFILSMLTEGNDDLVENYFDQIGTTRDVAIEYLALRARKSRDMKALFVTPHVHFGPFKTAGSATLAERIYKEFWDIPGITVFHTACTHAENLTRTQECEKVMEQIREDLPRLEFHETKAPKFSRVSAGKAKVIGTTFQQMPFLVATRHPYPSDDIDPKVLAEIQAKYEARGFPDMMFVDGHNAIIGDEVPVQAHTEAADELADAAEVFLVESLENATRHSLYYGTARDPLVEYSHHDGVGAGGLILHLFKIGDQHTVVINIDGNNAVLDLRSRLVNLLENKGIDKVEVCTSDTHVVARVFSSQGYNPVGRKIPIEDLLVRVDRLTDVAMRDLEPVEVATHRACIPGLRVWGDLKYFEEAVIPTLDRCVQVSKLLLTVGLVLPFFLSALFLAAFYEINIDWENFPNV